MINIVDFINENSKEVDFDELKLLMQDVDENSDIEGIADLFVQKAKECGKLIDPEKEEKVKEKISVTIKKLIPLYKEMREIRQSPSFKGMAKLIIIVRKIAKITNEIKSSF